jgi:hypothetical protein
LGGIELEITDFIDDEQFGSVQSLHFSMKPVFGQSPMGSGFYLDDVGWAVWFGWILGRFFASRHGCESALDRCRRSLCVLARCFWVSATANKRQKLSQSLK